MSQFEPHLSFDGNCAEAMRFYEKTLGGKMEMSMTYGEAPPMAGQTAPSGDAAKRIMHASMMVEGDRIMAAGHAARHAVRGHEGHHGVPGLSGRRQRQGDLRGALGRRQGDDALPEDVLGRRLRHVHRQVRHALDGQRRRCRRRAKK